MFAQQPTKDQKRKEKNLPICVFSENYWMPVLLKTHAKLSLAVIETVYAYGIWRGYTIKVSWILCNILYDFFGIALVRKSKIQIELPIVKHAILQHILLVIEETGRNCKGNLGEQSHNLKSFTKIYKYVWHFMFRNWK